MIELNICRVRLESAFAGTLPAPTQINAALDRSPLAGLLRSHLIQFSALDSSLGVSEQEALLEASESLAITVTSGAFNAHGTSAYKQHDSVFKAAQRLIHQQQDDHHLDVAAIARQLGCSRATLYRAFAAQGFSVAQYLRDLRLRNAYLLLQNAPAQLRIADLAARCGFMDHASFSRLFYRRFGKRPSDVRHSHREP
ncbi:MAG: helix-turn-helix domain-containing protein [Burkholderiaceae bacterium]